MRVLALVDGEHYPPVTRWGLLTAATMGHEVLAALFVGGTEKIGASGPPELGVPVRVVADDLRGGLARALDEFTPEAVLDLSDEPVLGYRERMEIAAVALSRGITYLGADFRLDPPVWDAPLPVPSLAVIGTGKRTGKTAIAGEAARVAVGMGVRPVVVAMGRGGPPEPQVAEPGSVGLQELLQLARSGGHAASDYLEDVLTTGVTTIGTRRCGGGLAGMPFVSNVGEGARLAVELGAELVILEGSGSSMPTVPWDTGVLVVPAHLPPEYLGGYLGPLRVLLCDLVVFTMGAGPEVGPQNLLALRSHVQRLRPDARCVVTDFQPAPLGDVQSKRVFFATTAPAAAAEQQVMHLEQTYGCRVVGRSVRLADRAGLAEDLERTKEYEILVTELKAAAVDVAAEHAVARGAGVVFMDNRPVTIDGDGELPDLLADAVQAALGRRAAGGRR